MGSCITLKAAARGGGDEDAANSASSSSSSPSFLAGKDDRYGGFIIDPDRLPAQTTDFLQSLRRSLSFWRAQGKKGIWLKLPSKNANLIPLAVEEGFIYHHAEKNYLMLTYWIPETPSTLPANASHQVGIGALIINDRNEILVVQEITGPTRGSGVWKIPTGIVLQCEDILDAVTREVKEETGVETEFIQVLGVRQAHEVAFGKSDLFFLCMLRPLSSNIVVQENEIAAAKWMPLEEFRCQPFNMSSSLMTRMADIATAHLEGQYKGFGAEVLAFGFRGKGSYFYHNIQDINLFLSHKSAESNESSFISQRAQPSLL